MRGTAAIGAVLCFFAMASGAIEPQPAEVTLTEAHPWGSLAMPSASLSPQKSLLEVPVIHIVNPEMVPFSISLYLEWTGSRNGSPALTRVPLGDFSVYPADQTGRYLVLASDALRKYHDAGGTDAREVKIVLRLRPNAKPRHKAPVQVTVGRFAWRGQQIGS